MITGATGFIGVNLVRRFAEAGDEVIAVDRVAPDAGVYAFLKDCAERVSFVEADVCDPGWASNLHPVQTLVHAAAVTNQRDDEELPRTPDAVTVNAGGTVNVMRWAIDVRPQRILYISSGAPYGRVLEAGSAIDEDTAPSPVNIYAVTKYAGELIALRFGELNGLAAFVARLGSHYGPMERATPDRTRLSLLQRWCNAAVRGERITANRAQLPRDYTYVRDGAEAIFLLAGTPTLQYNTYNVSAGLPLAYTDILNALRREVPRLDVDYVEDPAPNRADRLPLSANRLRDDTGWSPMYDMRQGIKDYIAWLRSAVAQGLRTR